MTTAPPTTLDACTRSRAAAAPGSSGSACSSRTRPARTSFGTAVALDGTDAVVGAPGRDGAEREQGAAFAFAHAAGLWVYARTLTFPAGSESVDAEYGAAVALDAGMLAIGVAAQPGPTRAGHQGLVYIYEGGQGAWTPRQTLGSPRPPVRRTSGAAVAVSGGMSSPARPTTTSRGGRRITTRRGR